MKRKTIIIASILIFISIIIIYKLTLKEENIPVYDANIICHKTFKDSYDDEYSESTHIVYLYEDGENLVKVINQAINENYESELFLDNINDIYNSIAGIKSEILKYKNKLVLEITYDYQKIDLKVLKNKLGNLLNEDSILMKTDKLPIKTVDYITNELSDYDCKRQ